MGGVGKGMGWKPGSHDSVGRVGLGSPEEVPGPIWKQVKEGFLEEGYHH